MQLFYCTHSEFVYNDNDPDSDDFTGRMYRSIPVITDSKKRCPSKYRVQKITLSNVYVMMQYSSVYFDIESHKTANELLDNLPEHFNIDDLHDNIRGLKFACVNAYLYNEVIDSAMELMPVLSDEVKYKISCDLYKSNQMDTLEVLVVKGHISRIHVIEGFMYTHIYTSSKIFKLTPNAVRNMLDIFDKSPIKIIGIDLRRLVNMCQIIRSSGVYRDHREEIEAILSKYVNVHKILGEFKGYGRGKYPYAPSEYPELCKK